MEAASLEVDSVTQKKLSSSLEALKTSFETELTAVTKSVKASNEHFDDKINTMKQELTNVRSELQKMHTVLESQAKMKRLELASTRTSVLSFDYNNGGYNTKNSSALVKNIIENFMFGYGYILPQNAFVAASTSYNDEAEKKALFRKKLVKQVKDLIGSEPRLQDKGNGAFSIFYS